jgi:ATP-binding cassette subfamily F protein uup
MALLESCTSISKTFGSRALFENISLGISDGERLGLIGPNGAGKSTLLRILSGQLEPDSGSISMRRNTRIGYVPQQTAFPAHRTAAEIVTEAIAHERLDDLERAARINITLGRAGFTDGAVLTESLSGGWTRRLAIARELALQPDLLFLDEPTNHLDLEGILWLEKLLATASFASVVVSHDRYFLDNVVNDKRFCWRNPAARNRSPTRSVAKWSGSAVAPRRAPENRAPAPARPAASSANCPISNRVP